MNRLLTIVDSKYQRLEYLESTGTQYINTGYVPNPNTEIDTKLEVVSWNNKSFVNIFGCRTSNHSNDTLVLCRQSSANECRFEIDNQVLSFITNLNIDTICNINTKGTVFNCNGTDYTTNFSRIVPNNLHLFLFGLNQNGNIETTYGSASTRIYHFKISENGVVKKNFVPVLRKTDNELGMLDLVEGKFYPNAGTGKFTANLDTMYATIQGSPTQSPYGVFSGFSSSNYLEIPKFDKTSAWEMVYCFRTPNSIDDMKGNGIIQENVTTTYKTRVNISIAGTGISIFMSSTGTNFDIGQVGASNVIDVNTKYFLKVKFTGTQYIWSLKSTGDYSVIATINSSTILRDSTYKLGTEAGNGFTGSIDLNRSYIKLGSTKYKIVAVPEE